ncbi:alpha/beta hydrolase [Micromonospora avicenniae]|uniref:alpha/beta hydrolase n=1 Tax=Micromonospora avicenniae TaxID=1198245 RepID=UPI0034399EDA
MANTAEPIGALGRSAERHAPAPGRMRDPRYKSLAWLSDLAGNLVLTAVLGLIAITNRLTMRRPGTRPDGDPLSAANAVQDDASMCQPPDTIMLIHGLWLTPRGWEHWIPHYRQAGYQVLAPAYPGLEVEVEELRSDPSPIGRLTIDETVDHYESLIRTLPSPPILIGHSFGATVVQLMLDRGLGAVGVAINSVPVKGVRVTPLPQVKAALPVIGHVSNRRTAIPVTFEQFRYAFVNACTEDESRAAYERYHVPAPGRIVWDGVLANFSAHPAPEANLAAKAGKAPLLFIASAQDRLMSPSVNHSNYQHYAGRSRAIVAYREFPGRSHFTLVEPGWQKVADFALDWARRPTAFDRNTHA